MTLKRITKVYPAEHSNSEHWQYIVTDGTFAVSLAVNSAIYEPGVRAYYKEPQGDTLALHVAWPVSDEEVKGEYTSGECEFIDAGRCYGRTRNRLNMARVLFAKHGLPQRDQPERLWAELERIHASDRAGLEVWQPAKKCEACCGCGIVNRPPEEES